MGTAPVFLSFFAVTLLTHWDSWDPVLLAFKKLMQCICRRRLIPAPRYVQLLVMGLGLGLVMDDVLLVVVMMMMCC